EKTDAWGTLVRRLGGGRPGLEDLSLFSRQMYALIKAGVPLVRGLSSLASSSREGQMKDALHDVLDVLESGRDLAAALARHPRIFNSLYVSVVRVGEESGRLDEAFLRLYHHLERERATRNQVRQAFRYPLFVLVMVAGAIAVATGFVIPAFKGIFDQFHAQLPLPTRIILAVSDFVVAWWPLIIALILGSALGWILYIRTEAGRYRWGRWKLRLPVVGDIINRSTLARYARTFSMTQRSGVPLTQSLSLISRALDNDYLGERVISMRNAIERGESIHRASAAAGLFTPLVLQMVAVGEETGRVDDMLEEVADFYEGEVEYDLRTLNSRLEPILIIVMGALVLVLALGVFLPMWDLYQVVLH
ncbi:MAG: type II secretion system F family protein, partial [Gammaproteobacteria bacterium]